ncbi:hypothetical protein [Lacticaseibacillus sp. N501-2]|uniref:hypothetical protein n=1 Tax=Lacticaseibacillus salsurae TaxID=3367729 RepID=UPI0038B38C6B
MIRKHYAWIVLLMFGLIAVFRSPDPVSAAPTFNPSAVTATSVGDPGWGGTNGYMSSTPSGQILTMNNGDTLSLPWLHARRFLNNYSESITTTLTIWRLQPDGENATLWRQRLTQQREYSIGVYEIGGEFDFIPDTPGTYYIQFSSNSRWNTATEVTTINVLPITTDISVLVHRHVLPSENFSYPATATVTPDDSIDAVNWQVQGDHANLISLNSGTGRQTSFNVTRPEPIEFQSGVDSLSAAIGATSRDQNASAPVNVLQLPAINASLASLTGNQIVHQLPELEKFASQFPDGTTWQYQWKRYETQSNSGVITVVGSGTIISEEGVSASGSPTALNSDTTQLVVNKQSTLMKRAVRASEAGTPLALTLELTANIPNVGVKNFTTNYAAFSVIRGGGALELTHVPEDWHTQYSFSEIYNHVVKDNVDGDANNQLTVSDTRELFDYDPNVARWHLFVSATPFSDGTNTLPFVVDLILGRDHSNAIRVGATPIEIATGGKNKTDEPVNYDREAHTRVTSEYKSDDQIVAGTYSSTLNWNLTTDIQPEALN